MKLIVKKALPTPAYDALRFLRRWRDYPFIASFLFDSALRASFRQRLDMVRQAYLVSFRVPCPHRQQEVLSYSRTILSLPASANGVLIEAGCFKGGSTAKFSLAADVANRELVVFDSFCGIPPNDEVMDQDIYGRPAGFPEGIFCGALEEVRANVTRYGRINRCRFIEGWFDDTMPHFHEPIAAAYIDVDLVSSTKTCLKYLFPLLQPGGILYSQDGHLPLVIEALDDDSFWQNEVRCKKPRMVGLGESKLVKIIKDAPNGESATSDG
ncbi:MAG: TylF/MycF/NovP-related O-methyltransferase [Pirellulales bacterium]